MNSLDHINPDSSQSIWRYLDFPRFISILENRKLYFSRLDLLGDPFEGSVTTNDLEKENELFLGMSVESGTPAGIYEAHHREREEDPRHSIFVSCWHMGENESIAMWKLYSDFNKGIAIKTSVSRLQSFIPDEGRIRCVQYLDYTKESVLDLPPFYCKRDSFSYEKEVRAVIPRTCANPQNGISVEVKPNELIEGIRLAPNMEEWLCELVIKITSKYGVSVNVKKSNLLEEPVFNWRIENGS